jgi:hypothetical protein
LVRWHPKYQFKFVCPGCDVTKPYENTLMTHNKGANDRSGFAIRFANYVEHEKVEAVKKANKSRQQATTSSFHTFILVIRGQTFNDNQKKAAAMQMIEALENDSIVVPDHFLEELSSEVDEFEHVFGLSKEETPTKYLLYKRLLAQYNPNKRARYNEYVDH